MKGVETMKTSIRFYDDSEVRAIWDDSASKWWFSVLDIVAAINRESAARHPKNGEVWYNTARMAKGR
jgi:cell filamentation protein